MTTPRLCCKICGFIDDYNNMDYEKNLCIDCLKKYANVDYDYIRPSKKVWKMIEKDIKNNKPISLISRFYGVSRNSIYLHIKEKNEKKIDELDYKKNKLINEEKKILQSEEKSFWIKLKELFK